MSTLEYVENSTRWWRRLVSAYQRIPAATLPKGGGDKLRVGGRVIEMETWNRQWRQRVAAQRGREWRKRLMAVAWF